MSSYPSLFLKFLLINCGVQFIFRYEVGDAYLGAVSRFMSNAFEYGDALLAQPEPSEPAPEGGDGEVTPRPRIESNQPYLNLAT
jgi:hypothetical protein